MPFHTPKYVWVIGRYASLQERNFTCIIPICPEEVQPWKICKYIYNIFNQQPNLISNLSSVKPNRFQTHIQLIQNATMEFSQKKKFISARSYNPSLCILARRTTDTAKRFSIIWFVIQEWYDVRLEYKYQSIPHVVIYHSMYHSYLC